MSLPVVGSRSPSLRSVPAASPDFAPMFFSSAAFRAAARRASTELPTTSDLLICPRSPPAPPVSSGSSVVLQSTILSEVMAEAGRRSARPELPIRGAGVKALAEATHRAP